MKQLILVVFAALLAISINAQSIYEIQGQTNLSPYNGQSVSTKGIVTAVYVGSYFIQDGDSEWTGLYVYDKTQTPAIGDSIEIAGTIYEYYDMTELVDITSFTVTSSGNTLPEPILIETGAAEEKWEGVLLRVENAECTNPDLGFGEWELNDGSGTTVVNDLGVVYTPIAGVKYKVTGPLSYSFEQYKLEPRTEEDIIQDLALFFTVNPSASDIEKTKFTLNWETNAAASSYVEYGLTTSYELGKQFSTVSSTTHRILIDNLSAGEIYYTQSYSINATKDTTPIHHAVFATQSESSGKINTYFNHERIVQELKSSFTGNIADTIISYITKAQTSIDIAIYDLTNHAPQSDSSNYKIIQAINTAFNKGVKIRLITDGAVGNQALDSLNANLPILKRNSDGIMHHKFLVVDAESIDNSWVVTGSTNWTYNNLFMDFNNMICIQDQSLAKAYAIEFIEMWGSNDDKPNNDNAKFGKDKTDNTPHQFNINEVPVELYFSPSDKTTSKIVTAIDDAKESVDFAMMVFTENSIANAIIAATNRGLETNGLIDYIESTGSDYNDLLDNGVNVKDFQNPEGGGWPDAPTLHHKFCIIDKSANNPLVISGTHNWSASAESKNDENTLFIADASIADLFYDEFTQIEYYMDGPGSIARNSINNLTVYPNPSNGNIVLEVSKLDNYSVEIFDIIGLPVANFEMNTFTKTLTIPQKGIYIVVLNNGKETHKQKIVIQ
ncbi:MAG: phospholipase D-like domain-containing protein [Salinivirgaceae bacterium]|jgi:phosphatidylserine/phosphatidylglycerophosphate/cardiolipin synthase-like enzyme|nr:phospholipase D-like domain-containing protein [Salinivirgaceae bacterium]